MSYIFKLVRANQDFRKKNGSRPGSNLLAEHHFAHRDSPPEHVVNFKPFYLRDYWDSDGLPHHSSDVKSCGESISDRITGARALYLSISGRCRKVSVFLKKILSSTWYRVRAWKCGSGAHGCCRHAPVDVAESAPTHYDGDTGVKGLQCHVMTL